MRRSRVGVVEQIGNRSAPGLWNRVMKPNFASIMRQVIAVWCEQMGHDVTFVCYTGNEDTFVSQGQDARPRRRSVLLRHVIDSLSDGVVVADMDGRCLLCNAVARRLFGVDLADVGFDSALLMAETRAVLRATAQTTSEPSEIPPAASLLGAAVVSSIGVRIRVSRGWTSPTSAEGPTPGLQ